MYVAKDRYNDNAQTFAITTSCSKQMILQYNSFENQSLSTNFCYKHGSLHSNFYIFFRVPISREINLINYEYLLI